MIVGFRAPSLATPVPKRMLIVTGLVAAFVGVCLGMARGGLLP